MTEVDFQSGRAKYNPAAAPDYTFDVDALSLQVVPDPKGAFPWSRYFTVLGAPGLTAFCGFEGCADAKPVTQFHCSSQVVLKKAGGDHLRIIRRVGGWNVCSYIEYRVRLEHPFQCCRSTCESQRVWSNIHVAKLNPIQNYQVESNRLSRSRLEGGVHAVTWSGCCLQLQDYVDC